MSNRHYGTRIHSRFSVNGICIKFLEISLQCHNIHFCVLMHRTDIDKRVKDQTKARIESAASVKVSTHLHQLEHPFRKVKGSSFAFTTPAPRCPQCEWNAIVQKCNIRCTFFACICATPIGATSQSPMKIIRPGNQDFRHICIISSTLVCTNAKSAFLLALPMLGDILSANEIHYDRSNRQYSTIDVLHSAHHTLAWPTPYEANSSSIAASSQVLGTVVSWAPCKSKRSII